MKITITILLCVSTVAILACGSPSSTPSSEVETWRGLVVAPEQYCDSPEEKYNFIRLSRGGKKDDLLADVWAV